MADDVCVYTCAWEATTDKGFDFRNPACEAIPTLGFGGIPGACGAEENFLGLPPFVHSVSSLPCWSCSEQDG